MTKIDPDLINGDGFKMPVPKKMDLQIIKFVIGKRMKAIEINPNLLQSERWDHSDVFYAARTWLNQHNWDTSVYNDNTEGGSGRRKEFYDKIKDTCEKFYHVRRHMIGIYPEDRAVMAYGGRTYAVGFDNLEDLMYSGTDVVCVEKAGTVIKMVPFTAGNGIAFIQSQGFLSEYGIALAQLTNDDLKTKQEYLDTNYRYRTYEGNLGNLTDCDSSGIAIGMKVKGATRLGIDLDTIDEINQVNKGLEDELGIDLPIELDDLQESNSRNTHWDGLNGIINHTGNLYDSLSESERIFYRDYLMARPTILGGNIRFIDYLEEQRIELNTVLAIVKPRAFWNWLRWKILKTWPSRNYLRGGLNLRDLIRTPTMNKFIDYCHEHTKTVASSQLQDARTEMYTVTGMYDDTDGFEDNVRIARKVIMGEVLSNVLQDERTQKIDLALEKIMKNGDGSKKSKSKSEADDEDEDDDGNEWDE
jgi:hypothetical protein